MKARNLWFSSLFTSNAHIFYISKSHSWTHTQRNKHRSSFLWTKSKNEWFSFEVLSLPKAPSLFKRYIIYTDFLFYLHCICPTRRWRRSHRQTVQIIRSDRSFRSLQEINQVVVFELKAMLGHLSCKLDWGGLTHRSNEDWIKVLLYRHVGWMFWFVSKEVQTKNNNPTLLSPKGQTGQKVPPLNLQVVFLVLLNIHFHKKLMKFFFFPNCTISWLKGRWRAEEADSSLHDLSALPGQCFHWGQPASVPGGPAYGGSGGTQDTTTGR